MSIQKNYRQAILIAACIALMFFSGYFPAFGGLTPAGMQVIGIFIGTVTLWLFASTTWPSILCLIALTFTPLYTYAQVLNGSMGGWITSFVIFSSIISFALRESGVLRRIAIWLVTRPFAQKSPWVFISVLLFGPMLIGSVMSPIPAFMVFMPIAEQIFKETGYTKEDREPQIITLGLLSFACLSTMTTPIAHTVPILAMSLYEKDTGVPVDFVQYTIFGTVTGIAIYFGILLLIRFVIRPDFSRFKTLDVNVLMGESSPVSKQEKFTVVVFAVVVAMWMLPGLTSSILPTFSSAISTLGTTTPPLIGMAVLCIIHLDGKPLLNFNDAMTKGVPWSAVMMVAATSILGSAVTNADAGITDMLVQVLAPAMDGVSPMFFVVVVAALVILITSFASNTVTVTMMYSISMPLVLGGAIAGVNPAALACVIGAGAAIAVAAPPADATCSIAVGTGWLSPKLMLKYGLMMAFVCALVLILVGYPLASALM